MDAVSDYDAIAAMYHRLWEDWYLPAALPALERLLFCKLAPGACVLDLCCGSGHVTKELVARGYLVTGIDSSAGLIAHAQEALPEVRFLVQDARELRFETEFDAIVSTFDSLNHILTLEGLQRVFTGAQRALRNGGLFLFDMNLEEAYSADLHNWAVTVEEANVTLVRGTYDRDQHLGATELIWFEQEGSDNALWRRHSSVVKERCYQMPEILSALEGAGFRNVDTVAAEGAGMKSQLGTGRYFFSAR